MAIENQSINFILPMLGSDCRTVDAAYGVFIGDHVKKRDEENKIFLLCDSEDSYYLNKIDNFNNHNLLLDKYNYDKYDMYMFNIPPQLLNDYNLFKQGRYSEFSSLYKNHIKNFYFVKQLNVKIIKNPEFSQFNNPNNIIRYKDLIDQIINKSSKLYDRLNTLLDVTLPKDVELATLPVYENEVFTEKTLKEILNLGEVEKWI
jgi:hypothetical protein